MTPDEILVRLRKTMKQTSQAKVVWDAVTADAAIASLGFDSLTVLDLLYDVQQEFGIEIEAEQIVNVRTVGQFVEFLHGKLKG